MVRKSESEMWIEFWERFGEDHQRWFWALERFLNQQDPWHPASHDEGTRTPNEIAILMQKLHQARGGWGDRAFDYAFRQFLRGENPWSTLSCWKEIRLAPYMNEYELLHALTARSVEVTRDARELIKNEAGKLTHEMQQACVVRCTYEDIGLKGVRASLDEIRTAMRLHKAGPLPMLFGIAIALHLAEGGEDTPLNLLLVCEADQILGQTFHITRTQDGRIRLGTQSRESTHLRFTTDLLGQVL